MEMEHLIEEQKPDLLDSLFDGCLPNQEEAVQKEMKMELVSLVKNDDNEVQDCLEITAEGVEVDEKQHKALTKKKKVWQKLRLYAVIQEYYQGINKSENESVGPSVGDGSEVTLDTNEEDSEKDESDYNGSVLEEFNEGVSVQEGCEGEKMEQASVMENERDSNEDKEAEGHLESTEGGAESNEKQNNSLKDAERSKKKTFWKRLRLHTVLNASNDNDVAPGREDVDNSEQHQQRDQASGPEDVDTVDLNYATNDGDSKEDESSKVSVSVLEVSKGVKMELGSLVHEEQAADKVSVREVCERETMEEASTMEKELDNNEGKEMEEHMECTEGLEDEETQHMALENDIDTENVEEPKKKKFWKKFRLTTVVQEYHKSIKKSLTTVVQEYHKSIKKSVKKLAELRAGDDNDATPSAKEEDSEKDGLDDEFAFLESPEGMKMESISLVEEEQVTGVVSVQEVCDGEKMEQASVMESERDNNEDKEVEDQDVDRKQHKALKEDNHLENAEAPKTISFTFEINESANEMEIEDDAFAEVSCSGLDPFVTCGMNGSSSDIENEIIDSLDYYRISLGDDIASLGDDTASSGDDIASSGDDTASSGDDTASSGNYNINDTATEASDSTDNVYSEDDTVSSGNQNDKY